MHFKSLVEGWSESELTDYYAQLDSISRNRNTDISTKGLNYILNTTRGLNGKLLDAGCGNGYLLGRINAINIDLELHGCDFVKPKPGKTPFLFQKANLIRLPYPDKFFDMVVCTHTIEHIKEPKLAINELIRVCKATLLIITPCQRYYYFTLDEHINFFPDKKSIIDLVGLPSYQCDLVQGDWIYMATNI